MSTILTPSWSSNQTGPLQAISRCVRTLTLEQIASAWFQDDCEAAEFAMAVPCSRGLCERHTVFAHPLLDVTPFFHWDIGDDDPSDEKYGELAAYSQGRWSEVDIPFEVYIATKRGVNVAGAYDLGAPKTAQWTHDIHVGQILINLIRENPTKEPADVMRNIVGEAAFAKIGLRIRQFKDLDMFVVDENESALKVIEFTGSYSETHIREVHQHCSGEAHMKLRKAYPGRKHYLYASAEGTEYFLV